MNATWKYVKPLEKETAVKDFLKQYHIKLPEKLVCVLENYNGGRPSEKTVVTSTGREYVFKTLLSFNPDDKESIAKIYPTVFGGTELFPFGSDAAGNLICYDLEAQAYVLYNHETDATERIERNPLQVFLEEKANVKTEMF